MPRALVALCVLALAACQKHAAPVGPSPESTGLASVPADAEVVVGFDIAKLADSLVVARALTQLMVHSADISDRWDQLKTDCKIDFAKGIKHALLAIGPHTGQKPGTGPVIMVVVGSLPEADLTGCVTKLVGSGGGGQVTGVPLAGHTLYAAKDGSRTMYFAYARPDTVVLGANQDYVAEALGPGKKAPDSPELTKWLAMVNQHAPLWAAGRVDPRVGNGLIAATGGKLSAGPVAFTATADPTDGVDIKLGCVMASAEDAKTLESFIKTNLAVMSAGAALKQLGPAASKITAVADREIVQLHAPLSNDDLNRLQSALDAAGSAAQAPAPLKGSGSAAAAPK